MLILLGTGFPYGILLVNVTGSFVIGLVAAMTGPNGRFSLSVPRRQFLMAGFCGGLTTYSFFVLGLLELLQAGHFGRTILYVVATLALCMVAVWGGHSVGARLGGPGREPEKSEAMANKP